MSQSQSQQPELVLIGRITSVYGLKGWVKVYAYTDPLMGIKDYRPWLIRREGTRQAPAALDIVDVKPHGKGIIALPEGCHDRDQAQLLVGHEIWTPGDQLPSLPEGEFYWHQLTGLKVVNAQGEYLGDVDHMIETGANDVVVVKATKDSIDDRERLLPYVEDEFIRKIDLARGEMLVNWEAEF